MAAFTEQRKALLLGVNIGGAGHADRFDGQRDLI